MGDFFILKRQVKGMTDKQRKFADEYLIDCNATRAYRAAYPHVKSEGAARACSSKLLTNPNIKTYIDEQLEKISSAKIATATEVLEYLTSVLRGESSSEVIVVEGCGDGFSEARAIDKAPDEKERLKAAELIGKRYGIFTDKMKMEVEPVVIVNDLKE